MKTILAIMQNQWFKDPARAKGIIERLEKGYGPKARRNFIAHALFHGGLSGRRILNAFGDELLKHMEWDECSREISGHSTFIPTPDPEHVAQVITEVEPVVIVTFGKLALDAVSGAEWRGSLVICCHPAARHSGVGAELQRAAAALSAVLKV